MTIGAQPFDPVEAIRGIPIDDGAAAYARAALAVVARITPALSHAIALRFAPSPTWRTLAGAAPLVMLAPRQLLARRQSTAADGFVLSGHQAAWCLPFTAGADADGSLVLASPRERALPRSELRLLEEVACVIGERLATARSVAHATLQRRWLEMLAGVTPRLHTAPDEAAAAHAAGSALEQALPGCAWWLVHYDKAAASRTIATSTDGRTPPEALTAARRAIDLDRVICDWPTQLGIATPNATLLAAAPVRDDQGRRIAAIVARAVLDCGLEREDDCAPIGVLGNVLGVALDLIGRRRGMRLLRREDPTTGCVSVDVLREAVTAAADATDADGRGAAFLLVQPDPLDTPTNPAVADALGVLLRRAAAEAGGRNLVVARTRPWQFAVLGEGLGRREATTLAARLRWHVRSGQPGGVALTASVGIALIPIHGTCYDDLLAIAAGALDEARRNGDSDSVAPPRIASVGRSATPSRVNASERLAILRQLARLIDEWHFRGLPHSETVAQRAHDLATQLGATRADIDLVTLAGELHDIGRALLPERLFTRDDLTPDEHRLVRTHVVLAGRLISSMGRADVGACVASVHERFDGNGDPHGLAGDDIPYTSRILAVANAFQTVLDSLGRGDSGLPAAIAALRDGRGSAFDPAIVDCLLGQLRQGRAARAA